MVEEKEKTFTKEEIVAIITAAKERQETLEALECARIVMTNTNQYPRFINRINHIIGSIEGVAPQTNQEDKDIKEVESKPEPVVNVKRK
jgi:hypothetical protein